MDPRGDRGALAARSAPLDVAAALLGDALKEQVIAPSTVGCTKDCDSLRVGETLVRDETRRVSDTE